MHAIGRLADQRACKAPGMGRETLFALDLIARGSDPFAWRHIKMLLAPH